MLRKILMIVAGVAALSAAAAVGVVALAFALYALVEPYVGAAGGGAVVAAAAALLLLIAGLGLKGKAEGPRPKHEEPVGLVDSIMGMAKKRPIIAAGAAVAAGVYALRNPALLAAVLGAVLEKRSRSKD